MIRRFRKEAEEIKALDMEVSDIVDLAVDALEERGVMEIDYQEGEEPAENEAICIDEEGNQAHISVMDGVLTIDLDEEDMIEVELDETIEEVKAELEEELNEKFEKNEKEEARRRFEAWKKRCKINKMKREGKRINKMRKEDRRVKKSLR